ncbi:hypothetical protein [Methanobrevibacter sp.]
MSVKYDDYRIMTNKIAYWIIKNNKKVKLRKEYSLSGKKKSFTDVKKIILKNQNTTNSWGRKFLEAMVIDNNDTSLFPNYVTHNGKQYSKAKYIYMAKYVTSWWKTHEKRPATVPTEKSNNSSASSKLHDYITTQGCSGMGQCNSHNCGPNSLQQCLYRLTGIKVDESTLAGWAGTTSSGTDHQGLETAVAKFNKKYGRKVKIVWKNFNDLGKNDTERWKALANYIKKGAVLIHLLYRLKWGHYEVPKTIGDILKILNSLGDKCTSTSYCGYIENRTKADQLAYIRGISQKSIAILTE